MSLDTKVALDYTQLVEKLTEYLDPVLSSRRTVDEPARAIMAMAARDQEFVLHWTGVIARSNAQLSYQFLGHVPLALKLMGQHGTRKWILSAMEIYDREGLYPGSAQLEKVPAFAQHYRLNHTAVTLDQIRPVLETFIRGLSGRPLKLEAGNSSFTDTETLFLPATINRFDSKEKNYQLYKVTAVHLWAQTWFGTFRRPSPDAPHLKELLAEFDNYGRALGLFNLLETIRLNACIERELPGLAREMYYLDTPTIPSDTTWEYVVDQLQSPEASVEDTLQATSSLYALQMSWPEHLVYQGGFDLDATMNTMEERLATDKNDLQTLLSELLGELSENGKLERTESSELEITQDPTSDQITITAEGEKIDLPSELEHLLSSLLQDLDQVPDDWLQDNDDQPNGSEYTSSRDESGPLQPIQGNPRDAFIYDEWDFRRQTYRKNWCTLRELKSHPSYDDFAQTTLERYPHLVAEIRRHFEALRGEEKVLKAQPAGDNIDIDALITAYSQMHIGEEMTDRLYTQLNKVDRDLAVIFMVDVSGSTKGWINEAERESLILLCQALEVLGDQYAIYGFSGMTRNRCEVYQVKTFDEPYNRDVRARISGLRPKDYTRMGVTIRHLTGILNKIEARTRILITLSDGKPDDYDGYRGEYGIEDTRQALLEARHSGIHPFCITIDTTAGDYLPHMYGQSSFVVIDEVSKLPLKVADIYRNLTT